MSNEMKMDQGNPIITRKAAKKAAEELGIREGDTILIHSSFKSIGPIEKGAESIIGGFLDAVGTSGTLVFPTLCQADWNHVYENWHKDAPSDVGYLTNYFRKLPGVFRSDQATHSVAALGKNAKFITQTHGRSGLRWGIFGSTPFSSDSPWEKMYHLNAKVILIGVGIRKCTFRHYVEYCFIDDMLSRIHDEGLYTALKARIWCYERWSERGVWPHINNEFIQELLDKDGKVLYGKCGNAEMISFSSKEFVDVARKLLDKGCWEALSNDADIMAEWVKDLQNAVQQLE